MRRSIGGRPCEKRIPGPQRCAHLPARRLQIRNLSIDRLEHPLRGGAHVVARLSARFAPAQKAPHRSPRKTETLSVPPQRKAIDDGRRVRAIARRRSRRRRQQTDALVISNRVDAYPRLLRDLANSQHVEASAL